MGHKEEQFVDQINEQITRLEATLTGDMFQDMEIREEIVNLQRQRDGIVCSIENPEDCENCGS